MRRFGRKLDVDRLKETLPITPMFFDALYLDGQPLVDEPLARRVDAAGRAERRREPGAASGDVGSRRCRGVRAARALAAGHEGVMAKAVDGTYAAGRRGQAWLKVKQARTLDLVVLAAEWGSGRRRGTLSNLHLGARDAERGGFVMLGKTFKGLTDEMLAWQTKRFLELEIGRDDYTVYVRPGGRRRDRVQRRPGEPAVSRRRRAPVRARQALSDRQDRRRGRHHRDRSGICPVLGP